jgi:hypothetical protein
LKRAPDKQNIFLRKFMERTADLREVFNEMSVEVGKTDKASYFFEIFRNGPINNGFNLN